MTNWQEKFKCWESKLRDSSEITNSKCIIEIRKTIDALTKTDSQATIACKVANLVCRVLNVKAGVELFICLARYIFNEHWKTFLYNYKYFLAMLIAKKHWNEVKAILPIIDDCEPTEATIKELFYIYSNCWVALIVYKQLPDSEFKSCTNKLAKALHVAHKTDTNEFLSLVNELFETNQNFKILLLRQLSGSETFISFVASKIEKCYDIDNINDFILNSSAQCLLLINIDTRNKTTYSLKWLKVCMKTIENTEKLEDGVLVVKLLTLLYFLLKVLNAEDSEEFDARLTDVLCKLTKILLLRKHTELWSCSGAILICNILFRYFHTIINKKVNDKNISSLIEILDIVFEIFKSANIQSTSCGRMYCLECGKFSSHSFWSLLYMSAYILRKAIKLQIKESKLESLVNDIRDRAMQTCTDSSCRELKGLIQCCVSEMINVAKHSIHCKSFLDVSYAFLETIKDLDPGRALELIGLYKNIFKLKEQPQKVLEMQCIYIAHLLSTSKTKESAVLGEIALCCAAYTDAKMDFELTICDILDRSNLGFKTPTFDRKLMTRLQLKACAKYDRIDGNLKINLAKKFIMETCDEFEFAETVSLIGKITFPEMQSKVEHFIETLRRQVSRNKSDARRHLALGRLRTYQYRVILEQFKEASDKQSYSESKLHEIDIEEYKKFDMHAENKALKLLREAAYNFEQFYTHVDTVAFVSDWSQIVDDVSFLARHFVLRGYIKDAYECWCLIYKHCSTPDLSLHRIRAVSFFAEYADVVQHIDGAISIGTAIKAISEDLLSKYKQIANFSPRQQNYILLAIVNIAYHYSRNGDIENAHMLANMARNARDNLKQRENCFDLISINLMAFNFNMILRNGEQTNILASPYFYIHNIMDGIANAKHITSEDSINLPAFLFRLITEMTYFVFYRLCSSPIRPYAYLLLQYITDFALGLRMAQIVSLLAAIDLQMERDDSFEIKKAIMDALLMKTPNPMVAKTVTKKPKNNLLEAHIIDMYDLAIEPARRVALSPINFKQPYIALNKATITEYLLEHGGSCKCDFCLNPLYALISFDVGCLQARNFYINGDYSNAECFFSAARDWWKIYLQPMPMLEYLSFHSVFYMLIFYVNTLRRTHQNEKAVNVLEEAHEFLKVHKKHTDCTYMHMLHEIKMSTDSLIKTADVSARRQLMLTTPSEPPNRSRINPLKIISSSSSIEKSEPSSKESSTENDLNIVSNMINEWNISDIDSKDKENIPKIEPRKRATTAWKTAKLIAVEKKSFESPTLSRTSKPAASSSISSRSRLKTVASTSKLQVAVDSPGKSVVKTGPKLNGVKNSSISTNPKSRKKEEKVDQVSNDRATRTKRNRC